MFRIFMLFIITITISQASLKNFADGVVSVKESGGTISTKDRTVLFGGGYTMKTPNIKLTPFSVQAPSIKAGCGGIDMVFGSLGFLDKEQFVKFAEGIMAAAPGVAFDLALKTLCPSCSETLKALQAMANQINNMSTDSCAAATALGNMALDAVVGNNTKEDLKDNKVNNFFSGINENYLKPATGYLTSFNNKLSGMASGDPLYRPKLILFLSQTSTSGSGKSAYLLEYMFNNISYINGLDYKILRSLTGDIKLTPAVGDNPSYVNYLGPLDDDGKSYAFGIDNGKIGDINRFNTNTERILNRLMGVAEASQTPQIYANETSSGKPDAIESATTSNFPVGTLHKEYTTKVKGIISNIINRNTIPTADLEFLGRFKFPVYKIFNALGNNEYTQSVLNDTSEELATMLAAQILYELLITASFEIQKRYTELDSYAAQTTKLPITNIANVREYLKDMSSATKQSAGVSFRLYQKAYSAFVGKLNLNESIKQASEIKKLVMLRANPGMLSNLEFLQTLNK